VSSAGFSKLPIVVLACRVFQHWLEQLLPEDFSTTITFFDYGLHAVPRNLQQTLQQAIDSIKQPSLVVLGYGLCGNGLDKIQAGIHYLLIPRTDDCIAIMLGSYRAYRREMDREPGTYYLSKGWLEAGTNPLEESKKYARKYDPATVEYLMDTQYQHYRRIMLVARDQRELEEYRSRAQEVAAYCARWGMRYEEILGSDQYLKKLVDCASELEQVDDDFLLIPPGGILTQAQFIRR
jgi:hypothetical protein